MPQEKKPINQNLTVPNALSVLRIIVIPFFAWFFYARPACHRGGAAGALRPFRTVWTAFIARKLNQVTELGKMLDPLADKLTQGVVALCLAIKFPVICPALLVFILKELVMLCGAILLLKKKKRPCAAQWYGKVATVMFYVSVALIVVMDGFLHVEGAAFQVISYVLLGLTAA